VYMSAASKFIKRCLRAQWINSCCASWCFYGRRASCVGRNLFTCSERLDVSVNGLLIVVLL